MSFPLPDKSTPVLDQATGTMSQTWYDYFKFGMLSASRVSGNTTATSPPSGSIGEYLSAGPTSIGLTSGVSADVLSLVLPAGDWDIMAPTQFSGIAATTATELQCSLATVSGFMDNTVGHHEHWRGSVLDLSLTLRPGPVRVLVSVPTTYYLVAQAIFSGGTYAALGSLVARRY
jgi:hypothetical protein